MPCSRSFYDLFTVSRLQLHLIIRHVLFTYMYAVLTDHSTETEGKVVDIILVSPPSVSVTFIVMTGILTREQTSLLVYEFVTM